MKSRPVILGKIKVKSLTDGVMAEEVGLPEGRSSSRLARAPPISLPESKPLWSVLEVPENDVMPMFPELGTEGEQIPSNSTAPSDNRSVEGDIRAEKEGGRLVGTQPWAACVGDQLAENFSCRREAISGSTRH